MDGYLVSLDAQKAFDSIDHQFIISVLKKFGFHQEVTEIFKLLYNQITARVLVKGYYTDEFVIGRSVKQGDALSRVIHSVHGCTDGLN